MAEVRWRGPPIALAIFLTSFLGSIFILFPFFPFLFLKPRLWRTCCDRFVGFWLSFPVAIVEFLHGSKFRVSGDAILGDHPAVMIMNHRTRLDWLFFWSALFKMDPWLLVSEKISLKSALKKIPGAGWAMECNNFIFLNRNWAQDRDVLTDSIHYYKDMGNPYQLLLFPEGTDLCPKSFARMEKFATENGLPVYQYVLHPKTTGLCHILRKMRECDYIEYVYDIICAYGDLIVQTEVDFAKGHCSQEIHFHVERYHISEIPTEDEAIVGWVREMWSMKEAILGDFYSEAPADRCLVRSVAKFRRPRPSIGAGGELANDRTEEEVKIWPGGFEGRCRVAIWVSFLFWTSTTLVWTYFFCLLTSMRLYFALAIAIFLGVQWAYGGMDRLALLHWHRHKDARPPPTSP